MTDNDKSAARGAERMAEVEALLARYPNVTEGQIESLKKWFNREASALEVATLASRSEIRRGYVQFRGDHVDKFKAKEIAIGILAALLVAGIIALIGYMAS